MEHKTTGELSISLCALTQNFSPVHAGVNYIIEQMICDMKQALKLASDFD